MRVNRAIESGELFENQALTGAFRRARERGGNVHLLGLVSYGGVHSHIDHLRALLELARREDMAERTYVHAFTDGRDVSPTAARSDLAELVAEGAQIATVCGPLLRDGPRSALGAHRARAGGDPRRRGRGSDRSRSPALEASYARGVTDEFVEPVVLPRPADRRGRRRDPLQLPARPGPAAHGAASRAPDRPHDDDPLPRRLRLPGGLRGAGGARGRWRRCSPRTDARQLHAAETEKYAHVTYFFNGGREEEWPGETRILVPVPARRPDLRQEAGDVGRRGRRPLRRGDPERLPLRDRQLRQPGHGRPHRRHPGGRRRGGGGRRGSRPTRRGRP